MLHASADTRLPPIPRIWPSAFPHTVSGLPCRLAGTGQMVTQDIKSLSEKPYKRHPYAAYTDA